MVITILISKDFRSNNMNANLIHISAKDYNIVAKIA